MADSTIDLNVRLKEEVEASKTQYEGAKGQMTSKQIVEVERSLNKATNLASQGVENLTKKQLREFNSAIRMINNTVIKTITATANYSEATKKAEAALKKAQLAQKNYQEELSKAKSLGKINPETGRFEMYKSRLKREITERGITREDGRYIGPETFSKIASGQAKANELLSQEGLAAFNKFLPTFESWIKTAEKTLISSTTQNTAGLTPGAILAQDVAVKQKTFDELRAKDTTSDVIEKVKEIEAHTGTVDKLIVNEIDARNEKKAQKEETIGITPQSINSLDSPIKKQTTSIGKAVKQLALYRYALGYVRRAITAARKTIVELDKSLTEQAMVTGKTREQTYKLLKTYQTMSYQLGATTKEVAEVATQFMRQGKTSTEALKLTEAAISAAKVASISATDSVNYLTTALNGFRLSAEEAMSVSDKFAAISASSATSYNEIAIALSKVASQASLAGMSIDYTTALLAKGLETTREAPETIGTALKTVIARMREMTDYGETLEGDTDFNNVETQLAYVGIQLKTNNGELRSTEDVLDDLGRKWDTLNANQQAAVAKALAGTRQQSRLIAMMTDYNRVLELQEISLRSAGATAAQSSVYLSGMQASMNKISVAWEKIVSSFVDSDALISMFDMLSGFLDGFASLLQNTTAMSATLTLMAVTGATILTNKIKEHAVAKQITELEREQRILSAQREISEQKISIATHKEAVYEKLIQKYEAQITKNDALQQGLRDKTITAAQAQAELAKQNVELTTEETQELAAIAAEEQNVANAELSLAAATSTTRENYTSMASTIGIIAGGVTSAVTGSQKWLGILTAVGLAMRSISSIQTVAHRRRMVELARENQKEEQKTGTKIAGALADYGPVGLAAAAAILATVGVAWASFASTKSKSTSAASSINKMSNEIYTLENTAAKLKTALSTFDSLDKKIIKTTKDIEDMGSALDSAADSLTEKQKKVYDSLSSTTGKQKYLKQILDQDEKEADKLRRKQLDKLRKNQSLLTYTGTNSDKLQAKAAVYNILNAELYDMIDSFTWSDQSAKSAIEQLTQSIFENMDEKTAFQYANSTDMIEDLVDTLRSLQVTTEDATANIAEVLTSDDYSFTEKLEAYAEAYENLTGAARTSFKELYQELGWMSEYMSTTAINYVDAFRVSTEDINNISKAFMDLNYSTEEAIKATTSLFQYLGQGMDVKNALETLGLIEDSYEAILNAIDKNLNVTVLDMGQNIDKLKNTVQSFYEKAVDWAGMSETDRTSFITDNAELFAGDAGKVLLSAFESGNYESIRQALEHNDVLKNMAQQRLQEVQLAIDIEQAKGADANQAYLKLLQDQYKSYLTDVEQLFQASLKTRLDKQQLELDTYKEYLEKEQDALEKSLEDKQKAYEDYFNALAEMQEDEDYEEQANQLIANISRIGASSDTGSAKQQAELVKELEDLEKERLQQLRERAQEALINSIENEVSQINEKFDELLNNNRMLLDALTNRMGAGLIADMIQARVNAGATPLELQNYVSELQSAFSSYSNLNWGAIQAASTTQNNLALNVSGQTITLDPQKQQTLYDIIKAALLQMGVNT